ncbi:hypothetical protein VD0002_g1769 [Verticillium dahliae]|uniref:GTPase-activating protein GYP5 n=2 Tax=Verticillium dahliae TaxID=27337 RepID=G2WQG0_VERDV|nr:GTPase-activating protein GYP5 [Verticillium dahliae VdLs.17]KAF3350710.1 Elongator complex protein 3 [Verticillium dahliae VDG2]KAH6710394.1 GTPase-activating protein GYP5 [Verticillium dahliae]EGY13920.1 GTPase-activating protein GYP5 [Verticillium dahliae VdLs.17]PNH33356.1 hypothetical protein BJF96_g3416 [Verticillium dahliae]PNH52963.1 hypothetical protein VD0003_g4396 [Verticillium dahliae]
MEPSIEKQVSPPAIPSADVEIPAVVNPTIAPARDIPVDDTASTPTAASSPKSSIRSSAMDTTATPISNPTSEPEPELARGHEQELEQTQDSKSTLRPTSEPEPIHESEPQSNETLSPIDENTSKLADAVVTDTIAEKPAEDKGEVASPVPEAFAPNVPGSVTPKMAHDSMVTVRLSEPPTLTLDTSVLLEDAAALRRPSTVRFDKTPLAHVVERDDSLDEVSSDPATPLPPTNSARSIEEELMDANAESGVESPADDKDHNAKARRSSISEEVNWEQLQKTEAEEPKDDETDKSTAMLLAMLEKENDLLATNPKSVKVQAVEQLSNQQRVRPPSMAQLRDMVNGPQPSALRYSMLPPPPMTDLEFYAALVKDYQQTAARLPTLLSNKIRKGIPPPLRGVVWQSMSGACDASLEEQYERFSGESSPYEPMIGKDLGRSFPGVDMFRDPDGDGQRMLGRVLKCFSLYDQKIGYCQGLAFLVGPLLMHMPDKQAFCVLVRLMERYDLRSCFLPDLSGLHVRIYQFRELLRENLPLLSGHMEDLQVDPAYVSQWFLSFFATTCPLPMLFRIYDVIFAEGAPETLMRVALSLMRKNQSRILGCSEFEDVMQLLLSRGLWDCYHYNADEFVQDFVSLTGVVSREKLLQLEQGYLEEKIATANAARTSDVTTAAARFLGRIWATTSTKSSNLSPGLSAASRPMSILRRSTSKQSLASTLNSMEASSASVLSSTSTDATGVSRDSSTTTADDGASIKPSNSTNHKNTEERNLHSQIEDLLTALSELQRNNALLASDLQQEREQREEDKRAVRSLLDGLRKKASNDSVGTDASLETVKANESTDAEQQDEEADKSKSTLDAESKTPTADDLSQLLDVVEQRFALPEVTIRRRSSTIQPRTSLRDELSHVKDQLANAISQSQDYGRRIYDLDQEVSALKEQVKESHAHTRALHQDKQRLERQILNMRVRASAVEVDDRANAAAHPHTSTSNIGEWPKAATGAAGGLRELKLGRSRSTPSQAGSAFGKRTSSLPKPHDSTIPTVSTPSPSVSDHEALLLELVQAKTSEAIARQEADESKLKLESLRKAYGLAPGDTPPVSQTPSAASAAMGVFGRFTGGDATKAAAAPAVTTPPIDQRPAQQTQAGGFWGWRRA